MLLAFPPCMPSSNPSYPIERGQSNVREEPRQQVLRVAEVTRFPRDASGDGPRNGFALDESESGLCLRLEAPVPVGALLRVTLRDFDGNTRREAIVRVAWCHPRAGGRYNAGLAVVDEQNDERLWVQHAARATEVAVGGKD